MIDVLIFKQLLSAMGFVRAGDFDSEVWTNFGEPNSQVWVTFGDLPYGGFYNSYSFSVGNSAFVDFKAFYTFLTENDTKERDNNAAIEAREASYYE